ncbi:MAG: membrane glycosyltransferase [Granulosicoccus sp.]|jgi:membrane glycosyltransferase
MALQMDAISTMNKATPSEMTLDMPAQDFSLKPKVKHFWQGWIPFIARLITFGGAIALTTYATNQMILTISQADTTVLQWIMVGLFCITFVWIALAACAAVAGFIFSGKSRDVSAMDISTKKTVLLMPVYNEDTSEAFGALYAMGKELTETGLNGQFEIFIISDSNKPEVWVKETAAFQKLKEALSPEIKVWYRRRFNNTAKKAGNVHEFVCRWGGRYDYMILLDADSLLSASTLLTLMQEMASDENSGIIQTLPCLYRGDTLFARLQQFAGTIYGPIVARGITAWQGNDGNYWGHNAIIRVSAFAESAGLPTLWGVKPFSGDILSHDFVEAALMRRAGWSVKMLPALKGSWEESPPSLSDVAVRDRRWAQGNIQHLAVLKARGLRWPNRFHMLTGVMGYMASPFWFALILIGIAMAIQIHYVDVEYFTTELTLFPNWPVFDSERMVSLFIFTMVILIVPKVLGLIRAFFHSPLRKPLGIIRMTLGMLVETFFSVMYAPIFMLIHVKHIIDIFRGRDSGWNTQQRQYTGTPWLALCRRHFWHTVIGLVMAAVLSRYSPMLLIWLSPTLVGLMFSIPLSALSGSRSLAKILRYLGILNIPEEVTDIPMIKDRDKFSQKLSNGLKNIDIKALLSNQKLRDVHFNAADKALIQARGEPPVDKMSLVYKINDAHNQDEALEWMSNREKIALLADKDVFNTLTKLAKTAQ